MRRSPTSWKAQGAAGCLLASLVATACSDGSPTDPEFPAAEARTIPAPVTSSMLASVPTMEACGPTVEYKLTDGVRTPGRVLVSNDAEYLHVTYNITANPSRGWLISDTRLAIAR